MKTVGVAMLLLAMCLLANSAMGSGRDLLSRYSKPVPAPACYITQQAVLTITGPAASLAFCEAYASQLNTNASSYSTYEYDGVTTSTAFYATPFVCTSCKLYSKEDGERGGNDGRKLLKGDDGKKNNDDGKREGKRGDKKPVDTRCFATITSTFIPIQLYLWYFEYWAVEANGIYADPESGYVPMSNADPPNPTPGFDYLPQHTHGYLGNVCIKNAVTTYKDSCGGVSTRPVVCP